MKKKSSIIKLSLIGVALIIGIILSFCSFRLFNTGYDYNSFVSSIKLGLDLKGGVYAVYEANDDNLDNLDARLDGTMVSLQNLLVKKGYPEATIVREGSTRLRVEVPDVEDPTSIFSIIGKPAEIKFVLPESNDKVVITGKDIKKAEAGYDNEGKPVVSLSLNPDGAKRFGDETSANVNKPMKIIVTVAGEEPQDISTATINEAITGGKAQISMGGNATYDDAKNLADQIMSGTFDVRLALKESSTISATLGEKALTLGLIAAGVGLLLVCIFLIFRYRLLGFVASFALAIYTVLMLFFLAVLPWVQLTLPGIAGIILSLGMAVDGNIIIYERIIDEYRDGKSILASTYAGFKKATIAIVDSNITTIIAAIVLLIFGTGSIKGFGLTLLIGIILSMFSSLLVTRTLVKCVVNLNSENPKLFNLKRADGVQGDGEKDIVDTNKLEGANE